MSGSFNLSPNNDPSFNLRKSPTPQVKKAAEQIQPKAEQAPRGLNPFDLDLENLFTFKRPEIVYNKVMKSPEMLGFLKAQKVAGKFLDLTKPDHEVGKRLNFEI
ncbi:MAG: hypothetical protein WCF95_05365 [bacterium]